MIARKARTIRTPDFKAKVALVAVQARQMTSRLTTLHGMHRIQISHYK